jgi:hypothetical protein
MPKILRKCLQVTYQVTLSHPEGTCIDQLLTDHWVCRGGNISVVQFANNRLGGLGRNHEALPGPRLEAGKPRGIRDRR